MFRKETLVYYSLKFCFSYNTNQGSDVEEKGFIINKGTNAQTLIADGHYSYKGPDGVVYAVKYIADKNGFKAQGAHLPTTPPIPILIQRALDYQKAKGIIP